MDASSTKTLVAGWLKSRLVERWKRLNVNVFESKRTRLSRRVEELGIERLFPEWKAWDVRVDVTGIVHGEKEGYVALVDFVEGKVTLDDVGRLLACANAVNPILCMVLSREGPNDNLLTLLHDYGRLDILKYGREMRYIKIGQWHDGREEVIPMTVIPRGKWLW